MADDERSEEVDPRHAAQYSRDDKPRPVTPSSVEDEHGGQFGSTFREPPKGTSDDSKTIHSVTESDKVRTTSAHEDSESAAERSSRMKRGDKVGRFTLVRGVSGGKSRDKWIAQDSDGRHVFLKTLEGINFPDRADPSYEKLAKSFNDWETHHRKVLDALRGVNVGDGALVLPIDQGRTDSGRQVYRVYPLVPSSLAGTKRGESSIPTLAEDLDKRKSSLRSPEERLTLVRTILLALWQLHRRGIVHGDIKPGNILVPQSPLGPVARLIDYDNCFFSGAPLAKSLIGGDENYFSPERADYEEGDLDDPSALTEKSDVYSFAKTLQQVFEIPGSAVRRTKKVSAWESMGLPRGLSVALEESLSRDPKSRPDVHHLLCISGVYLRNS